MWNLHSHALRRRFWDSLQVDFYALFGAVLDCRRDSISLDLAAAAERLVTFAESVSNDDSAEGTSAAGARYWAAARSAANDPSQRATRISVLSDVMRGVVS